MSPEIARLTTHLAGHRINDKSVIAQLKTARPIFAHNAKFDLGWIEATLNAGQLRYVCSMSENSDEDSSCPSEPASDLRWAIQSALDVAQ